MAVDTGTQPTLVDAQELEQLGHGLERASSGVADDLVADAISEMTDEVEKLARRYAPQDTGELVASIGAEKGNEGERFFGEVYATAPHAAVVEFGSWQHNVHQPKSGTYEIVPVHAKALRFEVGGEVVFAQKVNHPGVAPQPFLGPAVDEMEDEFTERIADAGSRLIITGPRLR